MAIDLQDAQREVPAEYPLVAVTWRAVGFGAFLVVALNVLAVYVRYVLHGSIMAYSHVPMAMMMVLLLMMIAMTIAGRLSGLVMAPGEWHTVLIMGLVGASFPCYGMMSYLIGYITAPYYFATEENAWVQHLHPHLPNWLLPGDEGSAITWFYEGLPRGASVPWGVWVIPMFWWLTVTAAAFLMMTCVAVIFRKQWVQNERLAFPAMAPLIDMTSAPGDGKGWAPEFTRSRLFWIGFTISFGVLAWNCISYFLPDFPRFPIYRAPWFWIDRQMPPILGFLGLYTIFFSYFASLEVLFSLWFFDLVFIVEGGWLSNLGYQAISPYYYTGVYAWQTRGAFLVLILSTFWVARRHLRDVVMKALGKNDAVDDSEEWMSYRAACIGFLVGMVYLFVWLLQMNFDPLLGFLLLWAVVAVYASMAKILAETGMPFTNVPVGPWGFVAPFFGRRNIPIPTEVAFRFSSIITSQFKGLFLTPQAHAGRVSEGIPGRERRRLLGATGLAMLIGFLVSAVYIVHLGYEEGAFNFNSWEINRAPESHFQGTVNAIKDRKPGPFFQEKPEEMVFFGIGGLLMTGLIFMRYRYVWWPLHPVGLALSGSWAARRTSFTNFIAWLIKLIMLKVGGPALYQKSRPLFVGLLVGYVLGVILSTGIDMVWFPERGHYVHRPW